MTNDRDYVLGVRLTKQERAFLKQVAATQGLSPSSALRTAALSKLLFDKVQTSLQTAVAKLQENK